MIYMSRWSTWVVLAIFVAAVYFALPNFLPQRVRDGLPSWAPKAPISLGLDLQGGSYLLLEVDIAGVNKERLDTLRDDIRANLRKARIGYTGLDVQKDLVSLHIIDPARVDEARKIITPLANPTGAVVGLGTAEFDMTDSGTGDFSLRVSPTFEKQLAGQIVSQSIEVVRRRIDELGTKEPAIQQQGEDRILVQVPGLKDPEQLVRILSTTAKMTFRLVDVNVDPQALTQGRVPPEDELLFDAQKRPFAIQRRVVASGDRLTMATAGFDQRTGQPNVSMRFDARGAREFGDMTKANVGKPFAIVLDNRVIEAPNIEEPILGGTGEIHGGFTTQSAADLAVLLRAGALPAALHVIEQRSVGAELGADSVNAGSRAALYGMVAVVLFMILTYGLFGGFATMALAVNMTLLVAVLTALQATLTLPGIAGIVLTMGMAVDANVLIYERIREEMHSGKSVIAAIDAGFRRATATIIDTNMTHVLAGLILFQLGVGPVRGFAVTLVLGVATSFFSAIMVTRLIVVTWMKRVRPKALTL